MKNVKNGTQPASATAPRYAPRFARAGAGRRKGQAPAAYSSLLKERNRAGILREGKSGGRLWHPLKSLRGYDLWRRIMYTLLSLAQSAGRRSRARRAGSTEWICHGRKTPWFSSDCIPSIPRKVRSRMEVMNR